MTSSSVTTFLNLSTRIQTSEEMGLLGSKHYVGALTPAARARLVAMLLDVDAGYRFVPALGTYRRELARFHAHLLSLVRPEAIAVTLRSGSRSWTVTAAGNRIRLDARD